LGDLYKNDGMDHLTLAPGELVVSVHLKKSEAGVPSAYEKARVRGSIDFPLAGAAVWLKQTDGTVDELRIATTGVNPHPGWIKGLEKYTGTKLDDDALDDIREMVRTQSKPMLTTTVKPWYRRRVVGAIARRLVARLAEAGYRRPALFAIRNAGINCPHNPALPLTRRNSHDRYPCPHRGRRAGGFGHGHRARLSGYGVPSGGAG
ncbi:MAG: hypothetical protein HN478_17450, partial [Rhodospirillaceae bacterium]|nr:hypothetical protein [Rhodospirillaceae bacterium]